MGGEPSEAAREASRGRTRLRVQDDGSVPEQHYQHQQQRHSKHLLIPVIDLKCEDVN